MALIPFDDDDDAVRIANDSNYGLGGSVWSADEDRALAVARQVRTGTIGLNYYTLDLGAPVRRITRTPASDANSARRASTPTSSTSRSTPRREVPGVEPRSAGARPRETHTA